VQKKFKILVRQNFVEKRKKQFFGVDDCLSDEIAFITSKYSSTIASGATRPAKSVSVSIRR
jgi:hypothetical protein